jgi:hypothetical protein
LDDFNLVIGVALLARVDVLHQQACEGDSFIRLALLIEDLSV